MRMEAIFEKLVVINFALDLFTSLALRPYYFVLQVPCLGIFEDNFSVHLIS